LQSDPTRDGGGLSAIRSVSQWERALLAQWFAGTDRDGPAAIVAAYVSERSDEDPRLRNMIVIAEQEKTDLAFLLYRPTGEVAWVLDSARTGSELGRYRTLPEALNAVRHSRGIDYALPAKPAADADQLVEASNKQ